MQAILDRAHTAFGGRNWVAVLYTPESLAPMRIVAMFPLATQAWKFISHEKLEPERHRVVTAQLTAAGAWSVDL